MNLDPSIRKLLDNETTIHEAQIRALYQTLDRKYGLHGGSVPIRFADNELKKIDQKWLLRSKHQSISAFSSKPEDK